MHLGHRHTEHVVTFHLTCRSNPTPLDIAKVIGTNAEPLEPLTRCFITYLTPGRRTRRMYGKTAAARRIIDVTSKGYILHFVFGARFHRTGRRILVKGFVFGKKQGKLGDGSQP